METYIARVYRQDAKEAGSVFGTVEIAGNQRKGALTNRDGTRRDNQTISFNEAADAVPAYAKSVIARFLADLPPEESC